MDTLTNFLIGLLPSLLVGVAVAVFGNQQKKRDKRAEERELIKQKKESVQLDLLLATAQLTYAVAMAIKRGKPNGEIETGIAQYDKATKKFKEFEREQINKI